MRSNRRGRGLAAVAAGLAVVMSGLVVSPVPAAAAPEDSDTLVFVPLRGQVTAFVRNGVVSHAVYEAGTAVLEGDFNDARGSGVLVHNRGILTVTPDGTGLTTSWRNAGTNAPLTPVVGDFDGTGIDDIFWYAPGPLRESLWRFGPSGSYQNIGDTSVSVTGTYRPVVIDADGDGYEDILWYAPGRGADSIWLFGEGGAHTSVPVTIDGTYQTVVGHFGPRPEGGPQERLLFVSPTGPDSIWTFDTDADHTSAPVPDLEGTYEPVVGRFTEGESEAIFWYRPGNATEAYWTFSNDGSVEQAEAPEVSGSYDPVVGDFDGNGHDEIAWTRDGWASIWSRVATPRSQLVVNSGLPDSIVAAAHAGPPLPD